ncbi:hypothetical protein QR680_005670 [Steinernema hermaphroditum]|uniref:Acyl-CoA thioesterase II domain-containing protein n=1 Tax=Steinernema hermaphroditum TaxID=289476 RepID=A0AA39LVT5_9BILA|nr:hypothetical protein QR680_005670 [Steinernema hermaphroditum]
MASPLVLLLLLLSPTVLGQRNASSSSEEDWPQKTCSKDDVLCREGQRLPTIAIVCNFARSAAESVDVDAERRPSTPTDRMTKTVYMEAKMNFPLVLHFDMVMTLEGKGVDLGEHLHEPSDAGKIAFSIAESLHIRGMYDLLLAAKRRSSLPLALSIDFHSDASGRSHCFFVLQYVDGNNVVSWFWKNRVFENAPTAGIYQVFASGLLEAEENLRRRMRVEEPRLLELFQKNLLAVSFGVFLNSTILALTTVSDEEVQKVVSAAKILGLSEKDAFAAADSYAKFVEYLHAEGLVEGATDIEREQVLPLHPQVVNSILTIQMNGAPLSAVDPRPFAEIWFAEGNSASDSEKKEVSEKMQMALGGILKGRTDDMVDYDFLYAGEELSAEDVLARIAQKRRETDPEEFLWYIRVQKMATENSTTESNDKKEMLSNGNGSACVCSSSRAEDIRAGLTDTFLELERIDSNIFLGRHLLKGRKSLSAVYGGQVIGQALSAGYQSVEGGLVPHSMHSYFLETGDVNRPILYMVDKVRDGRSFSTRIVKAIQDGKAIFTTQISFHKVEPDAIVHQHKMPEVTLPEKLEDIRPLIEKALKEKELPPIAKTILKYKLADLPAPFDRVFQFRPVNQDDFLMASKNAEPRSCFWLKANEDIGDDPKLNYTIAAFISDSTMLETALRPHCSEGFVPSMVFSLDHCIWLHKPNFRVDEWMLYENYSPVAGGSRGFIEGRLWTRDGQLVMSTTQEGLIRAPLKK